MISLTPVLFVEKIEPSLAFWEKGLGFERTLEPLGEGDLDVVILTQGDTEVMYQAHSCLEEGLPKIAKEVKGSPNFLYIKVGDLDDVIKNLEGFEIVTERCQTFYGADEIGYREPGGHFVTFAEFKEEQ